LPASITAARWRSPGNCYSTAWKCCRETPKVTVVVLHGALAILAAAGRGVAAWPPLRVRRVRRRGEAFSKPRRHACTATAPSWRDPSAGGGAEHEQRLSTLSLKMGELERTPKSGLSFRSHLRHRTSSWSFREVRAA